MNYEGDLNQGRKLHSVVQTHAMGDNGLLGVYCRIQPPFGFTRYEHTIFADRLHRNSMALPCSNVKHATEKLGKSFNGGEAGMVFPEKQILK